MRYEGIYFAPPRLKQLIPVFPYDWYVDHDNGNDAYDGDNPFQAFKTIAKLLTVWGAGESVWIEPKDDGTEYREALVYPGNGARVYSSGVYDYATDTYTEGAKISGADIIANASFSKTAGQTNVYEIAVTVEAGSTQFVNVFEDDAYLKRQTSIANVDANAGSYYPTAESGSITIYVHASDSSDVTANSKVYEYTKRIHAIYTNYDNCILSGLHGLKALGDSGCISFQGAGSTISHFFAEKGGGHTFQQNPTGGASCSNGRVLDGYDTTSATLFNYNANVFAGETYSVSNVTIGHTSMGEPGYLTVVGMNGHQNSSGALAVINATNIRFKNLLTGISGANHCDVLNLTTCTWDEVVTGFTNSAVSQTINVTGGSWESTTVNSQKFAQVSNPGTVNISGVTINESNTALLGLISITAAATVTVDSCIFPQNITTGTRLAVYCSSAGANVTLTNNTYNSTGNGWTYHYYFAAGASGMTWSSDFNAFELTTDAWFIFGTTYSDLASYQVGTSEDANSTSS